MQEITANLFVKMVKEIAKEESIELSWHQPPYYAVIFTSLRNENDDGYAQMAQRMFELAAQQEGYSGVERGL